MSVLARKLLGIGVGVVLVGVLIGFYVSSWVTSSQTPVAAISTRSVAGSSGGAQLTLQTVQTIGPKYSPDHPDWVSYLALDHGKWVHSGVFTVPANSLVHVTIYQYDGGGGLHNPFFGQVQGTTGGVETVDGKAIKTINPEEVSHTFSVPQLGLFVPLPTLSESNKPPCELAPCATSQAHRTVTFTFRTRGKGRYRWQCFVPCGLGYIDDNGGPMQTLGYMAGFLDVV